MVPAKYNLRIYRGRDFAKAFMFKDADGALLDISTWTLKAEVRDTNCQVGILLTTFTVIVDIATATILLMLSDTETLLIPEGTAYWDLLVTIGTEDQTYVTGKVKSVCTVTEVS